MCLWAYLIDGQLHLRRLASNEIARFPINVQSDHEGERLLKLDLVILQRLEFRVPLGRSMPRRQRRRDRLILERAIDWPRRMRSDLVKVGRGRGRRAQN